MASVVIISVLSAVLILVVVFLGLEMVRKMKLLSQFAFVSGSIVAWHWRGSVLERKEPGMRTIVLRGHGRFVALVGFRLRIPFLGSMLDHYAFVQSDEHGVAAISTYCGRGSCMFEFVIAPIATTKLPVPSSTEDDQDVLVQVASPPHWYQKIGFYG